MLTPGKNVEPEYLGYVIQSSAFVNRVAANAIGIAYPAIAETVLGRFPVALPPTVDEQQAKVKWREVGWNALIAEFAPHSIGAELLEVEA